VRGAVDGSIPDYQLAAWLMAVCLRGGMAINYMPSVGSRRLPGERGGQLDRNGRGGSRD